VGTSSAEAGGGVGRVFLPTCECARAACARLDLGERVDDPYARTSPATPAARRGGTGVVGMCLAESLRGLGGVYPDTTKVASHARAVGP